MPLFRPEKARQARGFPSGQAFAAGVFLGLSLTIMLPAGFALLGKGLPHVNFPLAPLIAALMFVILLAFDHVADRMRPQDGRELTLAPGAFPVFMTVMIAIPSFLLGTALGASGKTAALMILVAVMAHKGTAAFALALNMVRSKLTRPETFLTFSLFAFATPVGIIAGGDVRQYLNGQAMLVIKGIIMSLAAGTFLYMSTLHELRHTPLIVDCHTRKGYLLMLTGFVITALVRLILAEAHHG